MRILYWKVFVEDGSRHIWGLYFFKWRIWTGDRATKWGWRGPVKYTPELDRFGREIKENEHGSGTAS